MSKSDSTLVPPIVAELGETARLTDIVDAGVHPRAVYEARDRGTLVEITKGVYRLAELPFTEPDLLAVATRMPRAVLCTVSALHLHGLTLEIPRAVHVALPRGTHPARLDYPPLEVYHFSPASYAAGVEEREIDDVRVRLTSAAKSVADTFKFRSRLGLETALDALRQTLSQRKATAAELDAMARVCRVHNIMRPYIQALT